MELKVTLSEAELGSAINNLVDQKTGNIGLDIKSWKISKGKVVALCATKENSETEFDDESE